MKATIRKRIARDFDAKLCSSSLEVIMSAVTEAAERLRQWKIDQFTHSMQVVKRDRAILADAYLTEHLPDDEDPITEDWINSLSPHNRTLTIEYWIRDGRVTIGSVCGCDIVPSIIFTTRGQLRRLIAAIGPEPKPKAWRSIAVWPDTIRVGHMVGKNESDDTHSTREQAEAVCGLLRKHGFGGDGKVFPVSTRVEPVWN